jgi:membrane protease YdiL (CAAX protease family)
MVQPEMIPPETLPPAAETPQPDKGLWGPWQTIGFGVAIFAVNFTVEAVIAIVFFVSQWVANPKIDILNLIQSLSNNGLLISIATIVAGIIGIGFIILFIILRKGASIAEYLRLKPLKGQIVLILLGTVVALLAISFGLEQVIKEPRDTAFMVDTYRTSVWPVLLWISVVIIAPAFEEGFFRGFLFAGLQDSRIGAFGTIVLTAVTWALLHIQYSPFGMASILVLGLVFGVVRLKTNSLWSTLFLHSLWNLAATIQTVLYINGIGQ